MNNSTTEFVSSPPLSVGDVFGVVQIDLAQLLSRLNATHGDEQSLTGATLVGVNAILDNLLEGAVLVDTGGVIKSANSAFCALVGMQERTILGLTHWDVLGSAASIAALSVLDAVRLAQVRSGCEATLTNSQDKRVPVHIAATALRNEQGDPLGSIFFFHDRSRYRRLEEMNANLIASLQRKDRLIEMIVHDLRNPLTSLMTGLETIPLMSELSESGKKCAEIALRGGKTLATMIDNLLDVSKLEAGVTQLDSQETTISRPMERTVD